MQSLKKAKKPNRKAALKTLPQAIVSQAKDKTINLEIVIMLLDLTEGDLVILTVLIKYLILEWSKTKIGRSYRTKLTLMANT